MGVSSRPAMGPRFQDVDSVHDHLDWDIGRKVMRG
jgi:hypothetical protein